MRVLVANAGSSSLKLRVLDEGRLVASDDVPAGSLDEAALETFVGDVKVDAVGHRVVHGGTRFTKPIRIDPQVVRALEDLTDLAPLHQPPALAAIAALGALLPDVPSVACFDTAFHASLPAMAYTYALPQEWRTRWGLRRYGFHGLSHAYASRRAAELLSRPLADVRTVVCHLGAGASLCAVANGESVDTTMGFTPLDGLVMATRSGSIDPGLVLWLQESAGLSEHEVADALEHRSGLLGLGGSSDMRQLLERADHGDERAALAVEVYLHRLAAGLAAMAASMGGLDVIVFTGGVGENSAAIRERTAARLGFLGVDLGPGTDDSPGDGDISASGAKVRTVVVHAREDLEILRGIHAVLTQT